ncbi:MAG: hypothetical protein LUQ17_04875, partial [Methanomicrobiales archaeon]|nr:hypothetical protein [Methanomicrobiales archaeon]
MELYKYFILGFLCIALAIGAGCVQQGPPGNDTNQTCIPGNTSSCPSPTICTGCPGSNNITSFEECVRAGYPIMESYPRQCRAPDGPTFVENISRPCVEAGGNWNECSNRCQLDNQGNPNAICTLMCEQLCECGGVAGFRCPEGSVCRMPSGIPDALGYCVPETGGNLTRDQAYEIARNSTCLVEGNLTENAFYNPNSRTWWIDLELKTPRTGCNPACVVEETTHIVEINWRCTGLM